MSRLVLPKIKLTKRLIKSPWDPINKGVQPFIEAKIGRPSYIFPLLKLKYKSIKGFSSGIIHS